MRNRFDELLPFYVNGTLDRADREWIDAYLREHPQGAADVDACRHLLSMVRADVPPASSEVGLDRALARIAREGPAPRLARAAPQPPLAQRIGGWLSSLLPQPVLRPAFAVAMAVVAVQSIVIVQMIAERDETSAIRSMPGNAAAHAGPYLMVNFRGDAREADIRLLLVQTQAGLVAGPGQLGDYYLSVPEGRAAAVAEQLRSSAIVDAVALVDGLPARE